MVTGGYNKIKLNNHYVNRMTSKGGKMCFKSSCCVSVKRSPAQEKDNQ